MCHEISLIAKIDGQVKSRGQKVGCGQSVQAMVLNILGFVGETSPANAESDIVVEPDKPASTCWRAITDVVAKTGWALPVL